MALKTAKKEAAPQTVEKRQPDYVLRAKDANGRWSSYGAAWSAVLKDGVVGYSVKMNAMPLNGWDGTFLMKPPLESSD